MDKNRVFDKPSQSYWIVSAPGTNFEQLNQDLNVDIAIIGGGITGITCAYLLVQEGQRAVILESDKILKGTTGHTTAKITSQHGLIYNKIKTNISTEFAQKYADANEAAIRFIEDTVNSMKIDCDFMPQSAYVFTQQDKYLSDIDDEAETAKSLGINASYIESLPLDIPIKAAVRFDGQAQFHPTKYLQELVRFITEKGCTIYENTKAVDIEEANGYIITTDQGKRVNAKKVIIASHYPFYNKAAMYFARLYVERSYAVVIKAKEKYPGGMYISKEEPVRSLRSLTTDQGEMIIVGGEHHKTGQGVSTVEHYKALLDFADNTFTVEDAPYRWSTQDCMTLDDIPYTGYYSSKTPNLFIATGYGKWGMTNSTVSAMIIRDLIIKGESPWEDVYSPSRKTIGASAKNFVAENANVAKELIEGKLAQHQSADDIIGDKSEDDKSDTKDANSTNAISDDSGETKLKNGEARVVESNGERIGAYRDEEGTLHLVNTTCTHMGCELNWNSAEKSWDCPCHGSRFSIDGKVIEGPAIKPLTYGNDVNTLEKLIKDSY